VTHPAEQFFRELYAGQTGYIELRTFAPDTDATRRAVANHIRDFVPVTEGEFDFGRVSLFLRECERYQLGAFFGVALRSQRGADERKGSGEHCQVLTAIFVDADFKHLGEDETRRRLESLGLPPSLLVRSGGGLHPYWLLRIPIYLQMPGEMARAKKLLRDFARAVAGVVDESVSEPARVLRIPGSKNFKPEYGTPRDVELVTANDACYDLADIERITGQSADTSPNTDDRSSFHMPEALPQGDRHGVLFQLLRSLKAKGLSLDAAVAACHAENEAKSNPPLDRAKLDAHLRRSWHIRDQASFEAPPAYDDAGPLVLNPQDPLPSARLFLAQRHTIDGILTLRHQGSVFYAYADDAGAYYERDEPAVRSAVYGFLEPAKRRGKKAIDDAEQDKSDDKDKDEDDSLVPFQPTQAKVNNVLDALRAVCNLPVSFAAPNWIADHPGFNPLDMLACRNGLLHIPSRTIHAPTPNFFTLNGIDFDYAPDAPSPVAWLDFLQQLWPEDEESRETLQEIFGYTLTPDTRFQKILMLIGPKRSGKGVTGRVLRRLVGDRNTCSPTLASFGLDFGKQVLVGKSLAIISDARLSGRTDMASVAETLLSISGEDPQTIPRKFLPDWNGKLAVRFLILTNELPRIGDASGALASRFVVLPLTTSFFGREDLGLFDKLVVEVPGILNWALEGRDRLYTRGYFRQPKSGDALVEALDELGSPEKAFLRERCQIRVGASVSHKKLFDAWRQWCAENGRDSPGTTHHFSRNLRAALPAGVTEKRVGSRGQQERMWVGLSLVAEGEEQEALCDF
jgi:putative DNA primase/helicase